MISQVLKKTKERLSDYDNWCPYGPRSRLGFHTDQKCLIITISDALREDPTVTIYCDTVLEYIHKAMDEKFKVTVPISELNDGRGLFREIPATERWKTIHEVLDRAIKLAEAEEAAG